MFSPLVLSPFSFLSRSRCFRPSLFFLHSLLFISFASLLSLSVHVYARTVCTSVYTERGKFRRSPRYIYEEPLPLMVSMCSDAMRTCPARSACVHTRVRGAIPHACVRARVQCTHARMSRARAARKEDEEGFTHTHTHTRKPHGRELCLARDVKLLAIS